MSVTPPNTLIHEKNGRRSSMLTKYLEWSYRWTLSILLVTNKDKLSIQSSIDATPWLFAYRYNTANQENTLDFLEKVRTKAPFPIQKIRTDQGSEFRGLQVRKYLE